MTTEFILNMTDEAIWDEDVIISVSIDNSWTVEMLITHIQSLYADYENAYISLKDDSTTYIDAVDIHANVIATFPGNIGYVSSKSL